jgi:hypothetical protein
MRIWRHLAVVQLQLLPKRRAPSASCSAVGVRRHALRKLRFELANTRLGNTASLGFGLASLGFGLASLGFGSPCFSACWNELPAFFAGGDAKSELETIGRREKLVQRMACQRMVPQPRANSSRLRSTPIFKSGFLALQQQEPRSSMAS